MIVEKSYVHKLSVAGARKNMWKVNWMSRLAYICAPVRSAKFR